MPRNAQGNYTLPQPAFVPGTIVSASAINSNFDDIGTALTQSIAITGVTPIAVQIRFYSGTANAPGITFVGSTFTGFYSSGVDELSWSANTNQAAAFQSNGTVRWLGAQTLTNLVVSDDAFVTGSVSFSTALYIDYLNFDNEITTTASASANSLKLYVVDNNNLVMPETKDENGIIEKSGLVFLYAVSLATAAQTDVIFTSYMNFSQLMVQLKNIVVSQVTTGSDLCLRFSSDGGASFIAGASSYTWGINRARSNASGASIVFDNADSEIALCDDINNDAGDGISGDFLIRNYADAARATNVGGSFVNRMGTVTDIRALFSEGLQLTNTITDAIRFFSPGGGNITGGEVRIYGVL